MTSNLVQHRSAHTVWERPTLIHRMDAERWVAAVLAAAAIVATPW